MACSNPYTPGKTSFGKPLSVLAAKPAVKQFYLSDNVTFDAIQALDASGEPEDRQQPAAQARNNEPDKLLARFQKTISKKPKA